MTDTNRPIPRLDPITRPFWDASARGVLCFQQCAGCRHRWLPASVVCPACWAGDTSWVESSGCGRVFSFAVYHRAYHPAFEPLLPYVVAVIELEEGPRLVSNIVGIPPQEIQVGMPVHVEFLAAGDTALPVFRPVAGGA